jgi:hypothetical protein
MIGCSLACTAIEPPPAFVVPMLALVIHARCFGGSSWLRAVDAVDAVRASLPFGVGPDHLRVLLDEKVHCLTTLELFQQRRITRESIVEIDRNWDSLELSSQICDRLRREFRSERVRRRRLSLEELFRLWHRRFRFLWLRNNRNHSVRCRCLHCSCENKNLTKVWTACSSISAFNANLFAGSNGFSSVKRQLFTLSSPIWQPLHRSQASEDTGCP